MRTRGKLLFVLVILSIAISGSALVLAQEATSDPSAAGTAGTINCDADLLLNLYIAQRFFNYNDVVTQVQASGVDTSAWVDAAQFNQGQFGGLSGGMSTMGASGMTMGMLDTEQVAGVAGWLSQDPTTFDQSFSTATGFDAATGVMLSPAAVAGEDPNCTALRAQLYRFWQAVAFQDFSTGMTMGSGAGTGAGMDTGAGTGMGAEATSEATASG